MDTHLVLRCCKCDHYGPSGHSGPLRERIAGLGVVERTEVDLLCSNWGLNNLLDCGQPIQNQQLVREN